MADLYGTNNDRSFSSSSSLESEDMSSFFQSFLNNSSSKGKYGQLLTSPTPLSSDFPDSDHRLPDLSCLYSTEANQVNFPQRNDVAGFDLGCQVQKLSEGRQNSIPPRSSKRTRAAEIHNLSEKRRRSRINEKLKALQTLVPNSNKTDKASMLDEAIEYLKQLQLKVQTLTMRNGFGWQPIYSQEQEMQRGMGFDEGYKLGNPNEGGGTFSQNQGFSIRRESDISDHTGVPSSLTNMMKPDTVFGSELANENQYGFTNHLTSMKDIGGVNRPSKLPIDLPLSGNIPSTGVSS